MPIKTNLVELAPARERFKKIVTLLSKGYYAREAFPEGEITVYPWDNLIDDWVMENARKFPGTEMMWQLAGRLADLKGIELDDILSGDAGTILLVARSLRHRNRLSYTPTCTLCGSTNKEESIEVPGELEKVGEKPDDYSGTMKITLPDVKDIVDIRPLTIRDERAIAKFSDPTIKISRRTLRILTHIAAVGGGQGTLKELVQYYEALAPGDQSFLEDETDKVDPQLSPIVKHQCDNCGRTFAMALPIDQPDFFR